MPVLKLQKRRYRAYQGLKGMQGQEGLPMFFPKLFTSNAITRINLTEYSTNYKVVDLSIPQITSSIATGGAVFVYAELIFSGQTWTALPASWLELGVTRYFGFGVKTGRVRVRYSISNNAVPGTPTIRIKVVFMTAATVSLAKQKGVNFSDYNQVKNNFNIAD